MALCGMILEQKQRAQQLVDMLESRNVPIPFRHPQSFLSEISSFYTVILSLLRAVHEKFVPAIQN